MALALSIVGQPIWFCTNVNGVSKCNTSSYTCPVKSGGQPRWYGIDAWICEENSFNDGCTWGDGFDVIVDPTSTKKWLRFNIDVTNNGSDIFEPYFGDVGVIVGGKIIWQGWLQPTVSGGVDDLTVLPGTTDSGALYVQIPKGSSATQLVLRPNLFEKKFYFFKTN